MSKKITLILVLLFSALGNAEEQNTKLGTKGMFKSNVPTNGFAISFELSESHPKITDIGYKFTNVAADAIKSAIEACSINVGPSIFSSGYGLQILFSGQGERAKSFRLYPNKKNPVFEKCLTQKIKDLIQRS